LILCPIPAGGYISSNMSALAALHAALTFLEVNRVGVVANQDDLYDAMILLATSRMSKAELARFLRAHKKLAP